MEILNDATFEQRVIKAPRPVLVDVWGPGCQPCERLKPVLERLAVEFLGRVDFYLLNGHENYETAATLGIASIPTVVFFKDGQERARAQNESGVRQALEAIVA